MGDHVFLKVSPTKGVRRFGIKEKLSPCYVGPFEILKRIGLCRHLWTRSIMCSMLRKCLSDPDQLVELQPLQFEKYLSYAKHPIKILDVQTRQLRNMTQTFLKSSGVGTRNEKVHGSYRVKREIIFLNFGSMRNFIMTLHTI